jgi:hypothetical protein
MRRSLLLAAALALALALLAACDQGPAVTPTPPAPAVTPTTESTLPPTETGPAEPTPDFPTALPTFALPPPPTLPPTPSGLDDAQVVEIYDLVVRDLIQPKPPAYIAIAPTASQGEQLDMPVRDQPISPALIERLKDLGRVELVPFVEAIGSLETGGRVRDDGIFLTLGVIEQDPAAPDAAALYASWYRASDDATGYRYELTRTAGRWTIKNRTEVWDQ